MPPALIYLEVCPTITTNAGFDPKEPVRLLAAAGYDMFRPNESGELVSIDTNDIDLIDSENWVALRR